jgi:hypothetical protein
LTVAGTPLSCRRTRLDASELPHRSHHLGHPVCVTEEVLAGGVANAGAVVRVGGEVRRPSNPHSRTIHRFLSSLAATDFAGASVPLGTETDGRERLEFIEGDVAIPPYPSWVQTDEALASLARLMRRFHAASGQVELAGGSWSDDMADPEGGTVVCHNDVCVENVVFRDGVAVALLDFDFAAPGRLVSAGRSAMSAFVDGGRNTASDSETHCANSAELPVERGGMHSRRQKVSYGWRRAL